MATELNKPYTTLTRVKNEIRLRLDDVTHDDWLTQCVNDASSMVDEYTGRSFWMLSFDVDSELVIPSTWVFPGVIYLPWPVLELDELAFVTESQRSGVLATCWNGYPSGYGATLKVRPSAWIEDAQGEWHLRGRFGYNVPEDKTTEPPEGIPGEIVRAATLIASAISGMSQREQIGAEGMRVSVTDSRIPNEAKVLLRKAKLIVQ